MPLAPPSAWVLCAQGPRGSGNGTSTRSNWLVTLTFKIESKRWDYLNLSKTQELDIDMEGVWSPRKLDQTSRDVGEERSQVAKAEGRQAHVLLGEELRPAGRGGRGAAVALQGTRGWPDDRTEASQADRSSRWLSALQLPPRVNFPSRSRLSL